MAQTLSSYPIIRTKLYRPPISRDHLLRRHLLDKLKNHQHRPLSLISAPAGYGKSSLVSCWLQTCEVPSAWVSLDENDNDLRLFLTYFVSAIQRMFPVACSKTLSMLKVTHLPPVSVLAGSLLNELDQIEKEFILVLDDYHLIQDKSVHGLVAKLLDHPSAQMHLTLICRRDPPLPLSALRSRGKMYEVRTQDLRFSLAETVAFLQQMTGESVDNSIAAILEKKTEGWVTGLRLAALSLGDRKDFKSILTGLPTENRYIMDYVISEILSHQPPAIQECMLKTSILSRFCAPLCDVLCSSGMDSGASGINGREFLDLLDKTNLFVIPLDDELTWFRFHKLFQALLKRQLEKRFNKEKIAKLYKVASTWFAENGYCEEALAHVVESGDKEAAVQLVDQFRHDIMNREQWYYLNHCLQKFPPNFILDHPELLLAKAWVYQRQARYSDLFKILVRLEQVVLNENNKSSENSILLGEVQTLKSFHYYATGQAELSVTLARQALDNIPTQCHSVRGFALIVLSVALQMRGDYGQAQRVVYEALQQEDASIPVYKTMLLAALCFTTWIGADLNGLQSSATQLLKHGQKHDLPETIAMGSFFIGIFHYQRNNLDLAERFLAPTVNNPLIGELVVPSIVTYCQSSFALSLTYQAKGRADEASEIIESVIGYMLETGNAELLDLCQVFQADLALRQGRVAEADLWAKNYTPKPLTPSYRFYTPHLTLPKILMARQTAKSLNESDRLLCRIYEYYVPLHNTHVLIEVLILQALLHSAQGDESAAFEKLIEAFALAEPGGFIRPFLDLEQEMLDLVDRVVKLNPTHKYAGKIHQAFGNWKTKTERDPLDDSNGPRSSLPEEAQLEPLTNREIEVLRILAKGVKNNEIAESLCISPETVKRHLSTVYRKLDVKNRYQAVNSAKSTGIL